MRLFAVLILMLSVLLPLPVSAGVPVRGAGADPGRHPAYAAYDFGDASRVINVGIQPLGVPIGVIGEVMRRDRILRSELGKIGLEIRFHPFLQGEEINAFQRQGKIDAAMAGDMPTITTASSGDIMVTALTKQGFSSIVTKGHFTVASLKGKRIGYPEVSNAHYALLAALASAGLKESDVRMVPMAITDLADALAADRIDAFAAWEPTPSIALRGINDAATIYRYLNSSYFYVTRSLVKRHPAAAPLIMASMIRAFGWMNGREEHLRLAGQWTLAAAQRLLGRPMGLSADEVAALTMKDILSITSSPVIPERDLQEDGPLRRKFEFLKVRGKIPAGVSWGRVLKSFDRGILTGVLASPKKYRINSFDYDRESAGQ